MNKSCHVLIGVLMHGHLSMWDGWPYIKAKRPTFEGKMKKRSKIISINFYVEIG